MQSDGLTFYITKNHYLIQQNSRFEISKVDELGLENIQTSKQAVSINR